MPSIAYEDIRSRIYGKASMYDFLDLTELQADEFLCNWIRSASSKPYVRKVFSNFTLDDDSEELTFDLSYKIDDDYDANFVTEIIALGTIVEWLNPKIYNIKNINQVFGSSDEKWYSQAAHLTELESLKASIQKEQRNTISDKGYMWNNYLGGNS